MKVALKLDREKLYDRLVPNSRRPKLGSKNYKMAIPYVEAWYPEPINVSFIQQCLVAFPPKPCVDSYRIEQYSLSEFENIIHRFKESK